MSWTEKHSCGGCESCGMDMDMEPFCVNKDVLSAAQESTGHTFPYGLAINHALRLCELKHWEERKPLMCECGKREFAQCNKNTEGAKMCLQNYPEGSIKWTPECEQLRLF